MFDEKYVGNVMFTMGHLLMVMFFLILITLVIVFRNKIKPFSKLDKTIRLFLISTMIVLELVFKVWSFNKNGFHFDDFFGWCFFCMILVIINLFICNEKLFQFSHTAAILGACLSLIVADVTYTFPHFRFFHYFINHGFFLVGTFYLFFIHRPSITYKSQLKTSVIIFFITAPFILINKLFSKNFFYLESLPTEVSFLLDWTGSLYPVVWMILVAIFMFLIASPFIKISHNKEKSLNYRKES